LINLSLAVAALADFTDFAATTCITLVATATVCAFRARKVRHGRSSGSSVVSGKSIRRSIAIHHHHLLLFCRFHVGCHSFIAFHQLFHHGMDLGLRGTHGCFEGCGDIEESSFQNYE